MNDPSETETESQSEATLADAGCLSTPANSRFGLKQSADELVLIKLDFRPAATGEFIVGLYPSKRLRMLPAAIRAGDFDDDIIEG